VGIIVVVRLLLIDPSEQALREAIAEADRLDPGWRRQDLAARRPAIPDEQNAALRVLAARRLMPPGRWPPMPPRPAKGPTPPDPVVEALTKLPPPLLLDGTAARELDAQLASVEPALAEARLLRTLSRGRYPVAWGQSISGIRLDGLLLSDVLSLLIREAWARAQEGRPGDALAMSRAVLVVGRSLGDDPHFETFDCRLNAGWLASSSIERVLDQGTPPGDELLLTQQLLEDEAAQPVLLTALRGARADLLEDIEVYRAGGPSEWRSQRTSGLRGLLDVTAPLRIRFLQAEVLRRGTEAVEIAKLPADEQFERFEQMKQAGPQDVQSDPIGYYVWRVTADAEDSCRLLALLRCTMAGLALERFRQQRGHWPDRLDELLAGQLETLPLDPFDLRPLRYERWADGVQVSFSFLTPDNQATFGRRNSGRGGGTLGTDCGFRLWDPDKRRQPVNPRGP
jgi:hypothetical protein